ncbi:glycoside hydrolase family 130 protein [Thermotoga profunda]|uniref:glycoside hydrolase family 130 protein n=1 Tax=Thermotoga profunda TaxID=1508420 RepID=UPI0006945ECE|nr:glycoside hydrolase family 130 protein [Thermotoga profunda]
MDLSKIRENFEPKPVGELKSQNIIKRHPANPILTYKDVPYISALVFNPGVCKLKDRYIMVFRNDYGSFEEKRIDGTNLGLALSKDGIKWKVKPEPLHFTLNEKDFIRVYDPRLVTIEEKIYMTFAVDTWHGIRAGIAKTEDFEQFEIIDLSTPDNRNIVLFPEKVNSMYVRLERPFPVYGRLGLERFDIWISFSPDLRYWGDSKLLLAVEDVLFANIKIGPGAPPIKTDSGWLVIFHAVDIDSSRGKNGWEEKWTKRYTAGVMLLDLKNPTKVLGLCKEPLIVPEEKYETSDGFRNNVVFPTGAILEGDELKIYYGAADTVICLATTKVEDLVSTCEEF